MTDVSVTLKSDCLPYAIHKHHVSTAYFRHVGEEQLLVVIKDHMSEESPLAGSITGKPILQFCKAILLAVGFHLLLLPLGDEKEKFHLIFDPSKCTHVAS